MNFQYEGFIYLYLTDKKCFTRNIFRLTRGFFNPPPCGQERFRRLGRRAAGGRRAVLQASRPAGEAMEGWPAFLPRVCSPRSGPRGSDPKWKGRTTIRSLPTRTSAARLKADTTSYRDRQKNNKALTRTLNMPIPVEKVVLSG